MRSRRHPLPRVPALVTGWRARAPGAMRAGRALVCAVPAVRCARPGAGRVWRGAAVPLVRLVRSRLSRSRPLPLVVAETFGLPRAGSRPAVAFLARSAPYRDPQVARSGRRHDRVMVTKCQLKVR